MRDKGLPELFCVIIDVFGKPHHDYVPDLIRFYFYIAMPHVGLIEAGEESVR